MDSIAAALACADLGLTTVALVHVLLIERMLQRDHDQSARDRGEEAQ